MTIVENLQREELNCIEQAEAFENLSLKFHLTQKQIGDRVGMSRERCRITCGCWLCGDGIAGGAANGEADVQPCTAAADGAGPGAPWRLAKR